MYAVELNGVSKKFRKGERFDSLRDFIPNLAKGLFSRSGKKEQELQSKEFWALKDVSFRIKKGEALGIIGHNGAGKSTILKILSRILKPTEGEIKIHGRLSALIEVGAGFHEDLTGRENIYLNGAIIGMKKKELDKKLDSIIAFSELEDFIDTPVKRYSSGMYVRLGFSVAVHLDPEILLIDEVLSVGDFRFQKKCMDKMRDFIKNKVTIIFISHNLPSVIELCPNTLLLNKGKVQEIGESKKIVHDYYRAWGENHKVEENKLKFIKAELLNSSKEPCSAFKTTEPAILSLEFYSEAELKDIAVAFTVKREDGMVLFDAHSEMTANVKYHFRENEHKKIEIDFRASLPQGMYYAGVYLQQDAKRIYFYNDELLQFHVFAPRLSGASYTYLDAKWR